MSLPITSNEIRNLLREIHPDMNISEDSILLLQTIFTPLNNILTSLPTPLDRKNYIKNKAEYIHGAISKYSNSFWHKYNSDSDITMILYHLTDEILQLAGNSARDETELFEDQITIELYDIINVILNDEELNALLGSYLPLFPYRAYYPDDFPESFMLTGEEDEDIDEPPRAYIEYIVQGLNYQNIPYSIRSLLSNVIICVINSYSKTVDNIQLRNFIAAITNSILTYARQLQPEGKLKLFILFQAIYNNPNLSNVPWETIFRQCS